MELIANLFNWIFLTSVFGSLLVVIILLTKRVANRRRHLHYYLWFLLIARLIIPSIPENSFIFSEYVRSVPDSWFPVQQEFQSELETGNVMTVNNLSAVIPSFYEKNDLDSPVNRYLGYVVYWLPFIWLSGLILVTLVLFIFNYRFMLKTRNELELKDETVLEIAAECKKVLNIKDEIPIKLTTKLQSPALFGLFKPQVLLPVSLLAEIDLKQLRHILLHEFSHYKRGDYLVNSVVLLLKVLHWFNPIIWYGFAKMRSDCELACDAKALSRLQPHEYRGYGQTIIHLLHLNKSASKTPESLIGILSEKKVIKERLKCIVEYRADSSAKAVLVASLLIALSFLALPDVQAMAPGQGMINDGDQLRAEERNRDKRPDSEGMYRQEDVDSEVGITIEDIKGASFKGKVMLIKDPSRVKLAVTKELGVTGERVSDMVKDMGAVAGINAGGFYDPNGKGNGAFPDGLTMHEGVLVHNNVEDAAVNIVGFDDQNKLILGKMNAQELTDNKMREAVTFEPNLIVNGKGMIQGDGGWGIAPRTGIGQKADGTVIFVVIDGRQPTWSLGATLRDLMNIFADYGAVNAVNLDGGSSSELVYNGKVVNKLWNIFGERYIPTAFVVVP